MTFTSACAVLCSEPWNYRPWEVARLTPHQVNAVLCAERDDKGKVILKRAEGEGGPSSYRDIFFAWWKARNLPDHRIEQKWREYQEEERRSKRR